VIILIEVEFIFINIGLRLYL